MAILAKQDSNFTGLRVAACLADGTLPGSPVWQPLEPNSYSDFGGDIKTLARQPINDSRQRKKGVVVDLDASGGFQTDLTYDSFAVLAPGFMFAAYRTKAELASTAVSATDYTVASGGAAYVLNDLVFAKGFSDAANNGLKVAAAGSTATSVKVSGGVVAAGQTGIISKVGFAFTSGDAQIDASGNLISTTKLMTDFGLIPGEWIYIGGDAAGDKFAVAANNGYARVLSVSANKITLDKTQNTHALDNGSGKTIRIFFGRVLKNETGTSIVKQYYEIERTLGAPESTLPTQKQAQYLTAGLLNEVTFTFNTADKVTVDYTFVGADHQTRDYTLGVKSGTRPSLQEGSAFNTTSHVKRMKMSLLSTINTPLFAYLTDGSLTINNNISPNKAISVLGAFDQTAGLFEVSSTLTAYFSTVDAVQAIRNNSNVSIDFVLAVDNEGLVFDLPLVTLGEGRLNVEQDNPITLPLSIDAATAGTIDATRDYTLLINFFDYLPNAAM